MSVSESEKNKLSIMYEGDSHRDASDKVRGFLFQDYIAIDFLLNDDVDYVCLEYLEDIDVFHKDGSCDLVQVKYYPRTNPNMKEISTDLYYQFLRFEMLQSTITVKPRLYIHRQGNTQKLTKEKLKKYIVGDGTLIASKIYPIESEAESWLRKNVNQLADKETQKKALFASMASESSVADFIKSHKITPISNIHDYSRDLKEKLLTQYPPAGETIDKSKWELLLLGLAITYIQRRYLCELNEFDQICFERTAFDQYMNDSANPKKETIIVSYVIGAISEEYEEITNHNNLTDLQNFMLTEIYKKTVQWIEKELGDIAGQQRFINTLSSSDVSKVASFRSKSLEMRWIDIAECKDSFISFFDYLWKIMLDICQEKIQTKKDINLHLDLFDPKRYIDASVADYICWDFPEDKFFKYGVILPPAVNRFDNRLSNIVSRFLTMTPRPDKWFFDNSDLAVGKNVYEYSTANVAEEVTVADLGQEYFYIECMECIAIKRGKWSVPEKCGECVFSEKCVKER